MMRKEPGESYGERCEKNYRVERHLQILLKPKEKNIRANSSYDHKYHPRVPFKPEIIQKFILQGKVQRSTEEFDFSSFDKIKNPFEENLDFVGGNTMPALLTQSRKDLQKHISYLKKMSCGDYFIDGMDHYEKKSGSGVSERFLYGDF